jgi:hypothetical protein
MTFENVGLSDDGFSGGTITAYLPDAPIYVEIETDSSHTVEAHEHSSGLVTYSGTTLTIDCSSDNVKRISVYSRTLTTQEQSDIINEVMFNVE